jgi:hypothetical protein
MLAESGNYMSPSCNLRAPPLLRFERARGSGSAPLRRGASFGLAEYIAASRFRSFDFRLSDVVDNGDGPERTAGSGDDSPLPARSRPR